MSMNLGDRTDMRNHRRSLAETVAYVLLLWGAIALITSNVFSSSVLAFIGLGLTLWGALLLYIKPAKYVKVSVLDSTAISPLETIDQIITDLNYKGKAVYLPPRYLKDLKDGKVFISSKKNLSVPPVEEVVQQKFFLTNSKGLCLTPPGLGLANLYEKELGRSFANVDLNYLQNNLPKLLIEDLEIAEDLEVKVEGNIVKAKITGSINKDLCSETRKLANICGSVGCPLCSSIAIALTRATGVPVIIEKIEVPREGEMIEATFLLLETPGTVEPTEALLKEAIELYVSRRLFANLASLFLTAFGSIVLAWVGWMTLYDMTMWGKDIALIFFGSRTGEAISLGIGMKVIYYLVIGLALLLSGLLTFLRRRPSKG